MGKHKGGAHWWENQKSKIKKSSKKSATTKLLKQQVHELRMAKIIASPTVNSDE